jgi:hypothetical protein
VVICEVVALDTKEGSILDLDFEVDQIIKLESVYEKGEKGGGKEKSHRCRCS